MKIHTIINELFKFLTGGSTPDKDKALIYKFLESEKSELIICIAGKTGSGKSSLINLLFAPIPPQNVHHGKPSTREPREIVYEDEDRGKFTIIDLPGFCESVEHKEKIEDYYQRFLPLADVVLWLTRVDDSADECDQIFYRTLNPEIKSKIVFGISQLDAARGGRWNYKSNKPSKKQIEGIYNKIITIKDNFEIEEEGIENKVVCFSSDRRYNIDKLVYSLTKYAKTSSKVGLKITPKI